MRPGATRWGLTAVAVLAGLVAVACLRLDRPVAAAVAGVVAIGLIAEAWRPDD